MIQRLDRSIKLLLLATLTFLLVSACGGNEPQNLAFSRVQSSASECQPIQHDAGETTICGQPQKVAALSPQMLDIMLSLGVQPAAYAETRLLNLRKFDEPSKQIPDLGSRVTTQPINLGDRQNPSLEALLMLKPDLILGEFGLNQDEYDLLSRISPTLLFDNSKGGWQHSIKGIAKALGRELQAQQVLAAQKQQIAATRAKLAPVVAAYPRVLLLSSSNLVDSIEFAATYSPTANLLKAIGFQLVFPEGVENNPDLVPQISLEVLPEFDADIIIVLTWGIDLNNPQENLRREWNQNPVLQAMQVSKEGRVYFVDYRLWGSQIRGPIADQLILEALPKLLLQS